MAAENDGLRPGQATTLRDERKLDFTGNLKAVQRVLGHKDIATTGNTYVHVDDNHARDALTATVPSANLDAELLARASTAAREKKTR